MSSGLIKLNCYEYPEFLLNSQNFPTPKMSGSHMELKNSESDNKHQKPNPLVIDNNLIPCVEDSS